ncbi:MAG TPA: histidine kinase [Candidatus Dormibacteraeota bacterium]|nr:histidine kinase [Candidatus Dormibacteraeota bacterium]
MKNLRIYGLFALFTAIGLLFFSYHYLNDLADGVHGTAPQRFIEEMTGAYAALALVPFVAWVVRTFPWSRDRWYGALLAQLAGALGFSVAKTTLQEISRTLLFAASGLGHYNYGNMLYRYPMEFSNDIVVYAVIAGCIYIIARISLARAAELRASELQVALAQAKLENLRLQLHPHFLFNALNAISSVMYEDVGKADAMLARLSDFLRVILSSAEAPEVSLERELEIEGLYLDIMKARLENTLRLNVRIETGAKNARIPALLLQPIIENAIRHGMSDARTALEVTIEAERVDERTRVRIRDNGVGPGPHRRAGHGLANVSSRLSLLFGDSCECSIGAHDAGGTIVTLSFPYRHADA